MAIVRRLLSFVRQGLVNSDKKKREATARPGCRLASEFLATLDRSLTPAVSLIANGLRFLNSFARLAFDARADLSQRSTRVQVRRHQPEHRQHQTGTSDYQRST